MSQCIHTLSDSDVRGQWAIVFIGAFIFLLCVETWKLGKRVYFRRVEAKLGTHTHAAEVVP